MALSEIKREYGPLTLKVLFTILQIARVKTFYMPLNSPIWIHTFYKRAWWPKCAIYGKIYEIKGTLIHNYLIPWWVSVIHYHIIFHCPNVKCFFKQTDKILLTLCLDSIDGLLHALMKANEITPIVSGQLMWNMFNLKDPLNCSLFYITIP